MSFEIGSNDRRNTSDPEGAAAEVKLGTELEVSLEECERFSRAIASSGQLTFQTYSEGADARRDVARSRGILHGSLRVHSPKLIVANRSGRSVCLMINQGDGRGRANENVVAIRAIFLDLDGAPLEPVTQARSPPSITVESSPGRYHAYWLVRNMPLADFKAAQKALAKKFGGDGSVCDLARVMRLPGFIHRKREPGFRTSLLSCHESHVTDWPELARELELPSSLRLPDRILEGQRNSKLFDLAVASHRAGLPLESRLASLLTLNAERCDPPLSEAEVRGIVARAYSGKRIGSLAVPLSLLSVEEFVALGVGAKLLLLLSYQRYLGSAYPDFPLLWEHFKEHFPRENTFKKYRSEVAASGLLVRSRKYRSQRAGVTARCNFYRFLHVLECVEPD